MRIRPPACHQLPMPAQQRRRRDKRRPTPRLPRQHSAERRQQRPVRLRQLWTSDLPLTYNVYWFRCEDDGTHCVRVGDRASRTWLLTKDDIKNAPEYDESKHGDAAYHTQLGGYYGEPR